MPTTLHLSCLVTSLTKVVKETSQAIMSNHLPGLKIFSSSGHSALNSSGQY